MEMVYADDISSVISRMRFNTPVKHDTLSLILIDTSGAHADSDEVGRFNGVIGTFPSMASRTFIASDIIM